MSRTRRFGAVGFVLLALAGCSTDDATEPELLVLGPASLAVHLEEFNRPWAATGTEFSFAGSTTQVRAVLEGAEADVLITANADVAEPIVRELGGEPIAFVTNSLAVVTPPGNPAGIASLDDLARADLLIAICAVEVPCGAATAQLPVVIAADTTEPNVRAVLTKVEEGAVDVGVVYATDAAVGRVDEPIMLTADQQVPTTYVVFNLTDRREATDYVNQLLSVGREWLIEAGVGFDAP